MTTIRPSHQQLILWNQFLYYIVTTIRPSHQQLIYTLKSVHQFRHSVQSTSIINHFPTPLFQNFPWYYILFPIFWFIKIYCREELFFSLIFNRSRSNANGSKSTFLYIFLKSHLQCIISEGVPLRGTVLCVNDRTSNLISSNSGLFQRVFFSAQKHDIQQQIRASKSARQSAKLSRS